jgi:hypothetical protein
MDLSIDYVPHDNIESSVNKITSSPTGKRRRVSAPEKCRQQLVKEHSKSMSEGRQSLLIA